MDLIFSEKFNEHMRKLWGWKKGQLSDLDKAFDQIRKAINTIIVDEKFAHKMAIVFISAVHFSAHLYKTFKQENPKNNGYNFQQRF